MKSIQKRAEFIRLRAEGYSIKSAAKELSIAARTCERWDKEYREQISILKAEQLKDLYREYEATKEARIKKLGRSLQKIEDALEECNLSETPPGVLLSLKLKYIEQLSKEYKEAEMPEICQAYTKEDLLKATTSLYERIKNGQTVGQQAKLEIAALAQLERAINVNEEW